MNLLTCLFNKKNCLVQEEYDIDEQQKSVVSRQLVSGDDRTSIAPDRQEETSSRTSNRELYDDIAGSPGTSSVQEDASTIHSETRMFDSGDHILPDNDELCNVADDESQSETPDKNVQATESDVGVTGSGLPHSEQYNNDLLLLALKLRHKLSGAAVADLMNLLNFVTGADCVSRTNYLFDKQFSSVTSNFVFYYLCESCGAYVRDANRSCSQILQCTTHQCTNNVRKQKKPTFFVHLPVKDQLQDLLENHNVDSSIITAANRRKEHVDNYEDIIDGDLYKVAMPVSDYSTLSLSFNSDGVPVFSSSLCSIWPVLFTVNELPPQLRKEHVMLAALWFGVSKPVMNTFLEPFVNEICELNDVGFKWTRSCDKVSIQTKVKVLVGVCDSVARPAMQGLTQFNGKYGCSFCFDSGVSVAQGLGHTRAYPYNEDSMPRTLESVIDLSEQAMASKRSILGVKRPSVLALLPGFNIIEGLVPDYMHSVLLGVARQMAKLWFDSSNSTCEFYITLAQQRLIDLDLSTIRPPCNVSRLPRSLSMQKYWKAHEWYMWLAYYSLPILKSYLPNKFYIHFALLVEGISILLKDTISPVSLDHCDLVLTKFVQDFEDLYGLNNVSFNVHLCLHLTKSVRSFGPLWAHSAFIYESFNGDLLKMIRGTQAVSLQICKTFALKRAIPRFCASATAAENCSVEYLDILQSFLTNKSRVKNSLIIDSVTYLGKCKLRQLSPAHLVAVHFVAHHVPRDTVVQYYDRIIVHGEIVHSHHYCRNLMRNSYTVSLEDGSIFVIEHFIVANFGDGVNGYALGHYYQCRPHHRICRHSRIALDLSHLLPVERDINQLAAIPVVSIRRKSIFVNMRNSPVDIVCIQLNMFEYCT